MRMASSRRGFTLLELSIVIVIIGLIVGAVLVGKEMVRNSEVGSIIREGQQFRAAVSNFYDKYSSLPGDMANATKYWTTEVNGNGDQRIAWSESDHAWRHLVAAGIIAGNFTGTGDIATSASDSPSSRMVGVGWSFLTGNDATTSTTWFATPAYQWQNFLMVGKFSDTYTSGPFLTPREAIMVDTKMDDSAPYRGSVLGPQLDSAPDCSILVSGDYRYNVAIEREVCYHFIRLNESR